MSKAKFVGPPGFVDEDTSRDYHEASLFPLGREGLKPGYYLPRKGGKSFIFEVLYPVYSQFLDELFLMVYGVDAMGVWRKYLRHRGKPFIDILYAPGLSDGYTFGPKTCAKLYGDFVAFAPMAKKHFSEKDIRWRYFPDDPAGPSLWCTYRKFRKAFKIASDHGFVSYW